MVLSGERFIVCCHQSLAKNGRMRVQLLGTLNLYEFTLCTTFFPTLMW